MVIRNVFRNAVRKVVCVVVRIVVLMVVNTLVFVPISESIWHARQLPEELCAGACVPP